MATQEQMNTWLKLLPSNMQTTLATKLSNRPWGPTPQGKEAAAYVIRNFIAQEYGLANAEAILNNPQFWDEGRFISDFQTRVLYAYAVPAVYKDYEDPAGIAMEEYLVQRGILRSDQTLADTSHISPLGRSFSTDIDFIAVDGSSTADEAGGPENTDSDSGFDNGTFEKSEAPAPDFGQFLPHANYDQLIAGYDMSLSTRPDVQGSAEMARVNQQSSLLIQSLVTVDHFGTSDLINSVQQDEKQSHLIVAAPSHI